MAYQLTWEPNGVYWKYTGNVTGEEIVEASTTIYSDPRFDNLRYKLVDFLDAENISIDKDDVELISYQHIAAARYNPRIKTAIVSKTYSYLLQLFVENLRISEWEVEVFHHLDNANKWIDRNLPF